VSMFSMIPNLSDQEYERYLILVRQRRRLSAQIRELKAKAALAPAPVWGPCTRCGYSWTGRNAQKPKCCSRCRSKLWAKPRVRTVVRETMRSLYVDSPAMTTPLTHATPSGRSLTPPPPSILLEEPLQPEHYARPYENSVESVVEASQPVEPSVVETPADTHQGTLEVGESMEPPPCCDKPLVIDGVCISCGAGLEPHGNHAQ